MQKVEIVREFFVFLGKRKKYWLIPLILILILLAVLINLGEGSVVAPLVYPF
tara:strand:- start:596 stop:751 length:156 start_codon:yes stop_codon:yes gene_type:complete